MTFLLDTNVLLRSAEPGHPQHAETTAATRVLSQRGHGLAVVPQNLYEFWVAATRETAANGLGLAPAEVAAELVSIRSQFGLLEDGPTLLPEWERLVLAHAVRGKPAHDARLVAAMAVHGVGNLLTFNDTDFTRYPGIRVWTPAQVLASPP